MTTLYSVSFKYLAEYSTCNFWPEQKNALFWDKKYTMLQHTHGAFSINQSVNQYSFIWKNDITTDTNTIEI